MDGNNNDDDDDDDGDNLTTPRAGLFRDNKRNTL